MHLSLSHDNVVAVLLVVVANKRTLRQVHNVEFGFVVCWVAHRLEVRPDQKVSQKVDDDWDELSLSLGSCLRSHQLCSLFCLHCFDCLRRQTHTAHSLLRQQ